MIITILAALLALIFTIYLIKEYDEIFIPAVAFVALELIVGAVALLLALFGTDLPDTAYHFHDVNEYDLAEQSVIRLTENDHSTYEFFYNSEDGVRIGKISSECCSLVYDNEQAKVVEQEGNFNEWWSYIYSFPVKKHYVIYAPKETFKIQ